MPARLTDAFGDISLLFRYIVVAINKKIGIDCVKTLLETSSPRRQEQPLYTIRKQQEYTEIDINSNNFRQTILF